MLAIGVAIGVLLGIALTWAWSSRREGARAARLVERISEIPANSGDHEASGSIDEGERTVLEAVNRLDAARRRSLEMAVAELRLRERALANLSAGVVLIDGDREVVYANLAAHTMLGKALTGERLRHAGFIDLASRASAEPQESTFQDPMSRRWYHASASAVDETGFVSLVIRDETEERRLLAVRRDFVADASHELKTPVAAIQAAVETILTALGDGDVAGATHFAQSVAISSRRLTRLVSDLLDLSRLEGNEFESKLVNVTSLVQAVIDQIGVVEPRPRFHAADREMLVSGSGSDLALAVRNLLSNAIKYTTAAGTISVRLINENGWVTIEVSDTGAGIPTKDLPRIFERFYRVDPARSRATGGTGLGLSIVRHIAELHGGNVTVASVLGEGSTFRIRLPLANQPSERSPV